jgi:hypothetical protein
MPCGVKQKNVFFSQTFFNPPPFYSVIRKDHASYSRTVVPIRSFKNPERIPSKYVGADICKYASSHIVAIARIREISPSFSKNLNLAGRVAMQILYIRLNIA